MAHARMDAAPVPERARGQGLGGLIGRIALALARLVGQLLLLAVYWPWTHHRATAAFRRALREAGLPPEAVARLTANYAATGSPRQLLRLALRGRR